MILATASEEEVGGCECFRVSYEPTGLAAGSMMVSFPVSISITSSAALTFDDELTTRHKA